MSRNEEALGVGWEKQGAKVALVRAVGRSPKSREEQAGGVQEACVEKASLVWAAS